MEDIQQKLSAPWVIIVTMITGGLCFYYGVLWQYALKHQSLSWFSLSIPMLLPLVCAGLLVVIWRQRAWWYPFLHRQLEDFTRTLDNLPESRVAFWIVLTACLGMYTELMVIRLHASFFQLFGYFKNVSLLSCFLGLGIGYARGNSKQPSSLPLMLPFLAFQVGVMHAIRQFLPMVNELLQNPVSEQLALGLQASDHISHILTVYGFLVLVFAANALCFLPLGQIAAQMMTKRPKLIAYSWNLVGSVLGIVIFYFLSFAWSPPYEWFLVATGMMIVLLYQHRLSLVMTGVATILLVGFLQVSVLHRHSEEVVRTYDVYSPYQILTLIMRKDAAPVLNVNNVYYQRIFQSDTWFAHYALPHYIKPQAQNVLIVGSGTGNDVASALHHGAQHIDAVEIDPAILEFGKSIHPAQPYQSPKVTAHVNDARAFIRSTDARYDLIIYGLLDSHTLLSSMSSVRLDSFVYTVEAFREARMLLKPDGVLSITFSYISQELAYKISAMLRNAFEGQAPHVYRTGYDGGLTFVIGDTLHDFNIQALAQFEDVSQTFTDTTIQTDLSTDNWPFLYMPVKKYPLSYLLMIAVLLMVSFGFIQQFLPEVKHGLSIPCFFLGAGFMLIETKGITELALVYGSTWVVIGAVISAILFMAFCANLIVLKKGSPAPGVTYGLLTIALLTGFGFSFLDLSAWPLWGSRLLMTAILTLPLFFSGFAFSSELQKSTSIATALSSNLLGSMLGGFLEYNSMYFGFRALYILAVVMYGLAFWGSRKAR